MSPASCQAWILLSVPDEPAALDRVIGVADAINHAIPTQDELNLSLGFLQSAGFVLKQQNQFRLSPSGIELIAQARAPGGSIFDVWHRLASHLAQQPQIQYVPETLSAIEVSAAHAAYSNRFWQQYAQLKGRGEA